jgi:hypothetical protein
MYGELSIVLPFLQVTGPSLGIGMGGRHLDGELGPALHLFAGLPSMPVPLKYLWPYVEPYYRPQIGLGSGRVIHEAGLMLKFVVGGKDNDFSN